MGAREKSIVRQSKKYAARHINDNFIDDGTSAYTGKIFKNTISYSEYTGNPLNEPNLMSLEQLVFTLIESVKEIKKFYSVAHMDEQNNNLN